MPGVGGWHPTQGTPQCSIFCRAAGTIHHPCASLPEGFTAVEPLYSPTWSRGPYTDVPAIIPTHSCGSQ